MVEDSKTQAMKLEYLLYKNGYEPVLAASGEQAIELVTRDFYYRGDIGSDEQIDSMAEHIRGIRQ